MPIVKKLTYVILGLAALIFIIGALLPAQWEVTRTTAIQAPREKIYPYLADFRQWPAWSAFDQEDAGIRYIYDGPDSGAGAMRAWTSHKMGDGSQKITAADPNTGIEFQLAMTNGFLIYGSIRFEDSSSGLKVIWTDRGDTGANPFKHYMGQLVAHMLGGPFEKSLANLKALAEKP